MAAASGGSGVAPFTDRSGMASVDDMARILAEWKAAEKANFAVWNESLEEVRTSHRGK